MRKCDSCKRLVDEDLFFPQPDKKSWCKPCISWFRQSRVKKTVTKIRQHEQEQLAIRSAVKQHQTNGESFVYLLEDANRYKIGFSSNIEKRLQTFDTAHSLSCKLIAIVPGGRQLEQHLHRQFECDRLVREWFRKSNGIFREFRSLPGVMIFKLGYITEEAPTLLDVSSVSSATV